MYRNLKFIIFFCFSSSLFIFQINQETSVFTILSKILPIILLLFLLIKETKFNGRAILFLSIFFSLSGDINLEFKGEEFFIYGLASFLIAHIAYIVYFLFYLNIDLKNLKKTIPVIVYGLIIATLVLPKTGELLIPVTIYMLIILIMAAASILLKKMNHRLIYGTLSFVISDSIIAINKFIYSFQEAKYLIMITYYLAQFLIITSLLEQNKQESLN